jgi:hypothetical protein
VAARLAAALMRPTAPQYSESAPALQRWFGLHAKSTSVLVNNCMQVKYVADDQLRHV